MKQHSLLPAYADKELFIDQILSNIGVATALFMLDIVAPLREVGDLSATELGKYNHVTTGAAIYHLKRLELKNYIRRVSYRKWELGERYWEYIDELKKNQPHESLKYNKSQFTSVK